MATIMRKLNIISRSEGVYRTDRLRDADLGACQHSYVLAVCHHPGLSQEQLAQHLCTDKSNVARHLARLEKSGYVTRRVSETDKRITLVYPTQRMLEVLPQVEQIVRDWNAYLTEGLRPEELAAFQTVLDRMTQRARDYVNAPDRSGK